MTSNSSAETDSLLGGITVVGCSAEGVTAAATSPSTNGASPVMEKPPGITLLLHVISMESEPIPEASLQTPTRFGSSSNEGEKL